MTKIEELQKAINEYTYVHAPAANTLNVSEKDYAAFEEETTPGITKILGLNVHVDKNLNDGEWNVSREGDNEETA